MDVWRSDCMEAGERLKWSLSFPVLLGIFWRKFIQIIPYSYYLVYLRQRIYEIHYDKSNPCTSDLWEKELLFRLDFRHFRHVDRGRDRDHQEQPFARWNDRRKLQNDQTGYDHPVASDTERTVRNELESITFVVPLVCNQTCNTFCNTFFVLHSPYRWFLCVCLFGGVFTWLWF